MTKMVDSMIRRCREHVARFAALAFVALMAGALAPAVASADPPRISRSPEVVGTPQVGSTLRQEGAEWQGGPPEWSWWRCHGSEPTTDDCDQISGANADTYKVAEADRGAVLRIVLLVRNRDGYTYRVSRQTGTVTAAPAPPRPPTPTPTPKPKPTPTPTPTPPAGTGGVLGQDGPTLMDPLPTVRIRGRMTTSGARITLLTVRAPKGARITLLCRGSSCPAKRWARTAALKRLVKFQRRLRAGTRLTIFVTKAGRIGKHTTILIRRGKAPKRVDRCVYPGVRKPVKCPA